MQRPELYSVNEEQAFAPPRFTGFEQDRGDPKFRCPAAVRGLECHVIRGRARMR